MKLNERKRILLISITVSLVIVVLGSIITTQQIIKNEKLQSAFLIGGNIANAGMEPLNNNTNLNKTMQNMRDYKLQNLKGISDINANKLLDLDEYKGLEKRVAVSESENEYSEIWLIKLSKKDDEVGIFEKFKSRSEILTSEGKIDSANAVSMSVQNNIAVVVLANDADETAEKLIEVMSLNSTTIDVTGIDPYGAGENHNCSDYAIDNYDDNYHWQECKVCQKVIGEKVAHTYIKEYWTMGDSCNSANKQVHICECGYEYMSDNTRTHTYTHIYDRTRFTTFDRCSACKEEINYHECTIGGVRISCNNIGTCETCGYTWPNFYCHEYAFYAGEKGKIYCRNCKQEMGYGEANIIINSLTSATGTMTLEIPDWVNADNLFVAIHSDSTQVELKDSNKVVEGNKVTIQAELDCKVVTSKYDFSIVLQYPNFDDIDLVRYMIFVPNFSTDTVAPIVNVTDNAADSGDISKWNTNYKIKISGTENYCSSVNITMKDKATKATVYTGTASVDSTTRAYSLEFAPNIGADELGKEYEITVADTLENTTTKTITVSKVDSAKPIVNKTNQLDSTGAWSTTTSWSKTKDFTIIATDEGSNIAKIKFQDANGFVDDYGITEIDTSVTPALNKREYTFTGNVKGFVTANVYLVDEAGNETVEQLRIYNLDNTKPTIECELEGVKNQPMTITLKDSGAGIVGWQVTRSDTAPSENDSNWNNVTTVRELTITYTPTTSGRYYVWAKDVVGNINEVKYFNADKTDVSELTVTLPNEKYKYTGIGITPEPTVKDGTSKLIKDADYEVSYKENTESGVATVIITGKGAYTGTKEVTFLIYIGKTTVDVTGINPYGASENHNCSDYAIDKYNENYHWQECKVCQKVIGEKVAHTYTKEYWTMGESCSRYNKQVHICSCGYQYSSENTREHTYGDGLVTNTYEYFHHKSCKKCGETGFSEKCVDENGNTLSCSNLGKCAICNGNLTIAYHTNSGWAKNGEFKCKNCGQAIGTVDNYAIEYIEDGYWKAKIEFVPAREFVDISDTYWIVPNLGTIVNKKISTRDGKTIVEGEFKANSGVENSVHMSVGIKAKTADGAAWHITENFNVAPENVKPVIENIDVKKLLIKDGWSTNCLIKITGTENYCSSVNITMKDKATKATVYTGTASVDSTTRAYSLEFAPNIGADELGKEYEITVADILRNATTKTITVSKVDSAKPTVNKTNQLDSTGAWATATNWSKIKDFTIIATDEGSNIAKIKFQDANGFADDYGITEIDTSLTPALNKREYTFTGNVKGFVTANVYLVDEAGNETVEQLRIYNLDNTKPTIECELEGVKNQPMTITLKDSGAGIVGWQVTRSDTAPSENDSNWNNVTTVRELTITYTPTTSGRYYVWAKDVVGNINEVKYFNADKTDVSELTVTLPNEKYKYTGIGITPEPTVKDGTSKLIKDADYEVSYKENTESGVATVIITGKGSYVGTKEVTFLIYVDRTIIDVTGINPYGVGENHNCSDYAIDKHDDNYHWQECKVCQKVIGEKVAHTYTKEYWTMGDSCSANNKLVHICSCGYTYETENTREHKNIGYSANNFIHIKECKDCRDFLGTAEQHVDKDNNVLSCVTRKSGNCAICGSWISGGHSVGTTYNELTHSYNAGICDGCGERIIDIDKSTLNIVRGSDGKMSLEAKIVLMKNATNCTIINTPRFYNDTVGTSESFDYTLNDNIITISTDCKYNNDIEIIQQFVLFNAYINYDGSDVQSNIGIYASLLPEVIAPTVNSLDINSTNESNGWAKNLKITISGTENYCSSVNITMKEKATGTLVYTGTASVDSTTRAYSLEFAPNIGVDELGKEYEIIIADTLGNATTKTITVSKVDSVKPSVSKTNQLDSTGAWATATGWSKTKDFTVIATDEGSQIARIKFQDANGFVDSYGITNRNTSVDPITNMRKYTFTGNVRGYITANVYLVDAAGNETVEQLRIYNLDNTKPTIECDLEVIKNQSVSVTLKDSGSGIVGWQITRSDTAPSENDSNWNNVTAVNRLTITYTPTTLGRYYIWAKDAVGNVNEVKYFDANKTDVSELEVTLSNDKFEYTGFEITPKPTVKDGGMTLKEGTDYDISYIANVEPGVATVIITGKGAYTGTKEVTFLIYIGKTTVDVTGINPYGASENHNCSDYAIDKYNENYHWQECKVCQKVIGEKVAHIYAKEYWTMGESCSPNNKLVHTCECGWSYKTDNYRTHNIFMNGNLAYHVKDCRDCLSLNTAETQERHYNENGILGCSTGISGTCSVCGAYIPGDTHQTGNAYNFTNNTFWGTECMACGKELVENQTYTITYDETKFYIDMKLTYTVTLANITNTIASFYNPNYGDITNSYYTVDNNTIYYHLEGSAKPEIQETVVVQYVISGEDSNGIGYTFMNAVYLNPDGIAPEISDISSIESSSSDWNTNYTLTVSGTENYCSSVNITMKDKATGSTVYTGSAFVDSTTRAYSLEFAPNIGADELGKEYEIVVADTLGNTTTKTITVSKVDSAKPSVSKTNQLDSTGAWATATGWSKTKDFTVIATDEGSQIARIKFQDANGFKDIYGVTDRDTSTNPIKNIREYIFTGDVYGFVTANVYIIDAAGNETVEQLRIYNLDSTAPSIEYSGKLMRNKEFSITLKDAGSGVSAWQVTTTNTEPTSGWTSVTTAKEVTVKYTPNALGKYYIWAKDAVGNVSLAKEVDVDKVDVDELTVELEKYTYVFENKQIKPKETVKDGETVLTKGVDYEVSYGPNFDAGKGSVTITGKGMYEGSKSVLFDITPAPMAGYITINGINKCGETLTVDISGVIPTGCSFSYKWYTNSDGITTGGTAIGGATASKYIPEYIDIGKYIYVEVTASKKNYITATFADVTDKTVNKYDTVVGDINRKPTIRFEQKQLSTDEVEISAIIKSVNTISRISVNNVVIDRSEYAGTLTKENYEMTVTLRYRVLANGVYNFEVEDELGNVVSDKINVSTITNKAPAISYKKYNATYFEGAKIVFESDIAVRIKSPEQYEDDGITFDTKYYATKITARIAEGKDMLVDKTFEFESDKQVSLSVTVQAPIYTKNFYIRTAKESTSPINVTVSEACSLAEGMSNSKALVGNKVEQYYGTRSNIKVNVATGKDLDVAQVLGASAMTSSIDTKGILNETPATENVATSNGSYMNSNVTGVYTKTTGMLDTDNLDTNSTEKYNTFRLTIKP